MAIPIGETAGWLGQSLWLREVAGREAGPPPPVDLAAERRNGDWVRGRILAGAAVACHDVSDGGLLVAVAEMAMAGDVGATLHPAPDGLPAHGWWFGEDQGRYVVATPDGAALAAHAAAAGVPAHALGRSGGAALILPGDAPISLATLRDAHARFFPAWMNS